MTGALVRRCGRRMAVETGHTLTELLVASIVMIILLGATLAVLDLFHGPQRQNEQMNEAQDRVRLTNDRLARDLRNLVSPTPGDVPQPGQSNAIEIAEPDDLVFWTVDQVRGTESGNKRNVRRVRYCLDSANRTIVTQSQTWTTAAAPAVPATVACPDPHPGWDATGDRVLAERIVNRIGEEDRPVFLYNAETLSAITAIRSDVFVDADPVEKPVETSLATGVLLRNQDRAPVAQVAPPAALVDGSFRMNGSASADPEGGVLTYSWYVDGGTTSLGTGVTFTWLPPSPGPHTVKLVVKDTSGLEAQAEVCAPCS